MFTFQAVTQNLRRLRAFDGNVEEIFGLTFEVSYAAFGQVVNHDLIPNGSSVPVTNDNRAGMNYSPSQGRLKIPEYISAYVKWALDDSVAKQFAAFSKGFFKVIGGPVFKV